eukprot:s4469_g5.t2
MLSGSLVFGCHDMAVKGKPEVKAMPKPKKMPQDSQLPPLKRMRMSPREPETPPPGHVVLVEPDLPQGRGAEIPQPSFPPRSRPREPSTPPPRRSDASSSGSAWRASRDWGDDRSQRRWRASSDEASALERHFDSGAVIPGALQMQIPITDAKSRDQQWKEAWPVIRRTLMSGGSVLGHCVAGRHRAAGGQARILSLITDTTFQEAQATVGRLRECQIYKLMEQGSIAQWIRHVRRTAVTGIRWPTPTGYIWLYLYREISDSSGSGPRDPALPSPPRI